MPKEETIQQIKIRNTIGEKTDLPIASTRSTTMSKLKRLLLKMDGTPNLIDAYGTSESMKSVASGIVPGTIKTDGEFLYVITNHIQIAAKVVKIDIDNFTIYSTLDLGVSYSCGGKIVGRKLFIPTATNPAQVVKIDLDSFTIDAILTLTTNLAVSISTNGTDLYVGHAETFSKVTKVNIETFTETSVLDVGVGEGAYNLETDDIYLYIIHRFEPIRITRVLISSFTVESTLTLTGSAAWYDGNSSCINGNYLYVSLNDDKFHKIDLKTFTLSSTLTTTTGYYSGSSISITGTYLIAAGMIAAGITTTALTYIDIATFTEYGIYALSPSTGISSFSTDGTFIYFGITDGTITRKYIQPTTNSDSRLVDNINTKVSSINTDLTALQADIGDFSSSLKGSLYSIIGNPPLTDPDFATIIDLIRGDTKTIENVALTNTPTAGSLSTFIATGGTTLGTQLPASKSLYDVLALDRWDVRLSSARAALLDQITALRMAQLDSTAAGKVQMATATINLNLAAATYELLIGTTQNVMVEKLIIRMPDAAAGGALTSISIQTNDSTPQVFISSLLGAVANLTAQAQLASSSPVIVAVGKKMQLTIAGGATGVAYSCTVTVMYRAVTSGGTLV